MRHRVERHLGKALNSKMQQVLQVDAVTAPHTHTNERTGWHQTKKKL
jgi:hypothetical protein